MITESLIDPGISNRLCLMLLHSLWQVTLLAILAWSAGRVWRRSLNRVYVWHVLALAAGLAAMPVTYLLVEAPAATQQTTAAGPVVPSEPAAEPGEPSLSTFQDAASAPMPVVPTSGPITEPVVPSAVSSTDSSTVTPSESTDSSHSWPALAPWVVLVYMAGVVMMFGRLSISLWSARRLVGRAQPITDGPLLERFHTLARRCSVPIRPALARARQIAVPKAVGLLKPTILLPAAALAGLTPEQLEMILIHELTHLRRHDLWVNLLQRLAEVLLFFNPALWWLSRRISTLREYGCDEMTCRTLAETDQEPRLRYAMALLQIARLSQETTMPRHHRRRPDPSELATLAAAGRSPSELRRRVAHLFGEPIHEPLRISRGGLVALLAVALAVILSSSLWPVIAQTDKTDAQTDQREASENRVEVIAIGTHNQEPQRWWDASGAVIEAPPFDWKEGHDVSGDDRQWRRVVIRVHDLAAGEEVRWEISGRPDSWGATVTVDGEKNPRGYFTRHFVVPESQHDLQLRVGIASGEWKTVARLGTTDTISLDRGEPSFISSGTFEENGSTTVFLTHDVFEHNFRVIAVDKDGRTHDSGARGGTSRSEKIYQSRVTFSGLSSDEIDHFEFQTRPYEWKEITGLPLRPQTGDINPAKATAATNPQDAQALDSTAVKLADGTTVRLVGVANNKDWIEREEAKKQGKSYQRVFWKPDGTKLPESPYAKPSVFSNERTAYEFAFQISGTEDFGCAGGEGYGTGNACTEDRKRIPNLCVAVSRTITADAPQADVTIGIASGKWQTVENWKGFQWESGVAGSSVIRNEKGIMLSWPTQQEDAVEVTLAHKYVQEQTRLVAFNAGKLVEGKQSGLGSGEGIVGAVYTFPDLALDDDFELAFQSRPYTWMTFRNISVRPGHRTNPQVSLDAQNGDDNDGLPLQSRDDGNAAAGKPSDGAGAEQKLRERAERNSAASTSHELLELLQQEAVLLRTHGEDHPDVRLARKRIEVARDLEAKATPEELFPLLLEREMLLQTRGSGHPTVQEVQTKIDVTKRLLNMSEQPNAGDDDTGPDDKQKPDRPVDDSDTRSNAKRDQTAVIPMPVVVAEHVLLLNGNEIITWDELEAKIAVLPDPTLAHPHFYITRGARAAGLDEAADEQIWRLRKEHQLKGHREGSLWPRTDLRYDRITSADDLKPDESRRVDGKVIDSTGAPVSGAEIVLITPIDESIPYQSYHLALVEGRIRNRLEHVMTVSAEAGQFTLYPPEEGAYAVLALHPEHGFAFLRDEGFAKDRTVKLLSWAGVKTTFAFDLYRESAEISLQTNVRETEGLPEIVINQYWSDLQKPDDTDHFDFLQVPPIFPTTLSRSFAGKQGVSFSVTDLSVQLISGETRELILGPLSEQQRERLESLRNRGR